MLALYGLALIYWLVRSGRAGRSAPVAERADGRVGTCSFWSWWLPWPINLLTVFSRRLSDNDQKYFLPLYTSLPLLLAFFLKELKERGRRLAVFVSGPGGVPSISGET